MDHDLVADLIEIKERRGTDRSAEISAACMLWVNAAIRAGHIDRPYEWDIEEHHAEASALF